VAYASSLRSKTRKLESYATLEISPVVIDRYETTIGFYICLHQRHRHDKAQYREKRRCCYQSHRDGLYSCKSRRVGRKIERKCRPSFNARTIATLGKIIQNDFFPIPFKFNNRHVPSPSVVLIFYNASYATLSFRTHSPKAISCPCDIGEAEYEKGPTDQYEKRHRINDRIM